ncbi:MAG TPA: class I SAM-dependent methyltransferase [Candidatus Aminicenantes bacterium]|nr:class I SAM-dependent methyltransferase [Candidatus Aminicenantes bacterium]
MKRTTMWIGGIAVAGLAALLVRRLRGGACPSWFSFVLDNPVTRRYAGAERLMRYMDLRPGMRVLDAGCGPGRLAIPFARRVGPRGEVVGLDLQADMLRRLDARVRREGLENVHPLQGGLGEGALEGQEQFDRAVLVTVLGEIRDKAAALAELFARLKPGGLLLVTEALPDPDFLLPRRVERLAGETGFTLHASHGCFPAYTRVFCKPEL